ncbi:prolyl oligopeptidase family serine peptidase [Mucilaginibacter sp. PAMB04168]|uniref:alpha/beta hydrolase family protein n=1 Tax=Mucilaginibacter sp. PAMB04168 TaxID=3138567 RepID=UPI0031F5FCF6
MKKKLHYASYLLVMLLIFSGCKKDRNEDEPEKTDSNKEFFVSSATSGSFTKVQLQALAALQGFGSFLPLIQYDVDFYKITYQTTYKGSKINASGLLCIPKGMTTTPALLSAQHGTMFRDADAPSNFPNTFTGFELFASAGFITVIPDFIGYGVSKDIIHPYYDMQTSGLAVTDMLKAAKYYLKDKNIAVNNKLFLIGYSEGGYVTMAAQKEIETHTSHNLTLTAAAEGAGGYDVSGMLAKVATVPTYPDPSFFALFMMGYNSIYNYNHPLTDFFTQPYATNIPGLLDGSKTSDQINAALPAAPSALFNPTFYSSLSNPLAETNFKAQVAANSFPNWYPVSPTRLYHGTADQNVYYETSQSTFNRFKAAGSAQITLTSIPGGTHETSVTPMMLDALPWFKSLAQ